LAFDAGITKLGRHGEQDIGHIIDWASKAAIHSEIEHEF
jgi:hypothetical protein